MIKALSLRIQYLIFCLLLVFHLRAEEWPTYSIVQLSFYADLVVEGYFLQKVEDQHFFLVRSIHDQEDRLDTLALTGLKSQFSDLSILKKGSPLILYLSLDKDGIPRLSFSGIRLWFNEKVCFPFQATNPGAFYFTAGRDSMTWSQLQDNVRSVDLRMQSIKALKKIEDPYRRNVLLFDFLEENIDSFGKDCELNLDCGWGPLEHDIFQWICEAGSARDTWRASQLYRSFPLAWDPQRQRTLQVHGKNAFKSQSEVDFLIATAKDAEASLADRKQALVFLRDASRIVYQLAHRGFEKRSIDQQKSLQKQYRNQLFPLLDDLELRRYALPILCKLSNPRDGNFKDRIDLSDLDRFIQHYQNVKEAYRYRGDLAAFIAYNADEARWKEVSDSDKNILIDLYHIYVDMIEHELHFNVRRSHSREITYSMPQLWLIPLHNPSTSEVLSFPLPQFPLPYNTGNNISIRFDISKLPKGKWEFYLKGNAGENGQYQWTSLKGYFENR